MVAAAEAPPGASTLSTTCSLVSWERSCAASAAARDAAAWLG